MNAAVAQKYITEEAYLEREESSLTKNEYYKGEVFAMAGASFKHNDIVRDTLLSVGNFLEDKTCRIYPSDIRIRVEANSLLTYPDLSIFCDPIQAYKNRADTATNPTVLIEVLSPSTEKYDRTTKFRLYQDLPSLKQYILISSTEMLIEKFTRQANGEWLPAKYTHPDDTFQIEAIGFSATVASLYRKVVF